MFPIYAQAVLAGLVPPFSRFFEAILSHYHISPLHLHPNSFTILAVFAFTCDAFVGIRPSVGLFRHFYSLVKCGGGELSGCVRFSKARDFLAKPLKKRLEKFRQRWI